MKTVSINLWRIEGPNGRVTESPHSKQQEILNSDARFKVIICGRRWGKSSLAIIKLLSDALATPNGTYWYLAPTYKQAKSIAWRFLLSRLRLFPKQFRSKCKIDKQLLTIELPNGTMIELKGVQEMDTLVGAGLDGVVLDEFGKDIYGQKPIWEEAIRPSLSDKMGWAIFIGTANGYNHLYNMYDFALHDGGSDWAAWRTPTSDNPYIPKSELEAARNEIGEAAYEQEYLCEFKKKSGLVYKEFSRGIHVIPPLTPEQVSSQWSLEIGVDFGAAHPTAAIFVLFDHIYDTAYVVDEHYLSGGRIEEHADRIKSIEAKWLNILKQRQPRIRWGDSAGKQEIIEYMNYGVVLTPTIKGGGSVSTGIDAVRKRLNVSPLTGKPQLLICSNCRFTILEMENYTWFNSDTGGAEEDELMRLANKGGDKPNKIYDDAMDALRYVIQYHSPIGEKTIIRSTRRVRNPLVGI